MELILGVITDLMFVVRVGDAIRRAGNRAVFVGTLERALAQTENNPVMAIVDLSCMGAQPEQLIREMKKRGISVTAFGSHVDVAALKMAREAGADQVMPRSKFVAEPGTASQKNGAGFTARPVRKTN